MDQTRLDNLRVLAEGKHPFKFKLAHGDEASFKKELSAAIMREMKDGYEAEIESGSPGDPSNPVAYWSWDVRGVEDIFSDDEDLLYIALKTKVKSPPLPDDDYAGDDFPEEAAEDLHAQVSKDIARLAPIFSKYRPGDKVHVGNVTDDLEEIELEFY